MVGLDHHGVREEDGISEFNYQHTMTAASNFGYKSDLRRADSRRSVKSRSSHRSKNSALSGNSLSDLFGQQEEHREKAHPYDKVFGPKRVLEHMKAERAEGI